MLRSSDCQHSMYGACGPRDTISLVIPRLGDNIVYCHIPVEKRTKLDPTTEKGILVGYSETSKAYRVYIPSTRKIVERRDIKFEEERAFRKSLQDKNILEVEVPQQEEVPFRQSLDPPIEGQQKEGKPTSSRKRKPKWAEQLLKEASEQVKSPKTSVKASIPPQRHSDVLLS
jgi:hypothetical protein